MPGLPQVGLLEDVMVASGRYEEVFAQQRAGDAGYLRVQQYGIGEGVRSDEGVDVAAVQVITPLVEGVVNDALEQHVSRGHEVHHCTVIQRRFDSSHV